MPEIAHFSAPAHWRAIDFLSDLHLCEDLPRTFRAFVEHLESTDADALFVLGDLFEVWVGDDQRLRPFEKACVDALQAQAHRLWLGFMPGNRDFLVGSALCEVAGLNLLSDPTCLNAFGGRWLLTHGDGLCLKDVEYQGFRRLVRSDAWQQDFLRKPFDERWTIASGIRSESRSRKLGASDPALWADVDREAGLDWLAQAGACTMIHGHTHRPGREVWGPSAERFVLSDWDLDHAPARAEVVRLDATGLARRRFQWSDSPTIRPQGA